MPRKLNLALDTFPALLPGDVLQYGGSGFIDRGIQFRLWDDTSHVEIYAGNLTSVASRNGIGVDRYLFRADGLRYVRRPVGLTPEQFAEGLRWFTTVRGRPYGWTDLLRFYSIKLPCSGLICSQFAAEFLRQCGQPAFALDYPAGEESPRDFKLPRELQLIWSYLAPTVADVDMNRRMHQLGIK